MTECNGVLPGLAQDEERRTGAPGVPVSLYLYTNVELPNGNPESQSRM